VIAVIASAHVPVNLVDAAKESKGKLMRIRKSTLKRIIAEATRSLNEGMHPYDKYVSDIAAMHRAMDAVDEIAKHVRAIERSDPDGELGEEADDFMTEFIEPEINYNGGKDFNYLLDSMPDSVKEAIMQKFNPSTNRDELADDYDY